MNARDEAFFEKNSELSIEFSRYVLEHPELEASLTEDHLLVFLPQYDGELMDFNMRMAKDMEREGGKIVYVRVRQLSPKVPSRLIGVEVEEGRG
jgi:hypothetical protein